MTDPLPVQGPDPRSDPTRGVDATRAREGTEHAAGSELARGAAFRAVLERLEQRAGELEARSKEELAPEELSGAVDAARESMQDVLSLQEQLLEAFRQSRHQASSDGEPDGPA